MPPADSVRRFFAEHRIEPCAVLAAVSGGADSTALLLLLAELRYDVVAAHVNHHLRGEESDADEAFVRELCARLNIPLHVTDGTLDAERVRQRGVEAAAREVRYARLQELRGDSLIATAHQKNDQAETVPMRLLTGSGIGGLRGIHAVRGDGIIRPLLDVTREEIDAYLRERGITPRHDRSNDDPRFLRNRVRVLLDCGGKAAAFENAVQNLAAIASQARQLWPSLERAIDEAEDVETSETETRFLGWPEDPWLRQALLHRHIHRLDPNARDVSAEDLARLASETGKRVSVTKTLELIRRSGVLALRRVLQPTPEFQVPVHDGLAHIEALGVTLHLSEWRTGTPACPDRQECLSSTGQPFQIPTPGTFTVRNRRNGDRFHPLGSPAPKKLKDFLIDRKIAAELRDRIPLLLWNGEIVWVAGIEISERFKISDTPGERYVVWLEGS
ncbi:MAG TPA: tRNA lysidine(34) synthetase TilS [Thermoanaerobaculia bacterium]|nr:tRNA lysidine(34) synthetase TilS [Thermoanaerobaculia bacterium]